MRVGLFFGSFNPVHHGHLILASHLLAQGELDRLRFVLSPQNPLKQSQHLANDYDRLHLLHLALQDQNDLEISDIELHLPKPSYTIDTLTYLAEREPEHEFVLIMGSDNLISLPKWKHYELLLQRYEFYVYARPNYPKDLVDKYVLAGGKIRIFEQVPQMEISATHVRARCRAGLSLRYWVPDAVAAAIEASGMYQ